LAVAAEPLVEAAVSPMVLLEPVVAELSKEKDVDFSVDCVALAVAVALLIAVSCGRLFLSRHPARSDPERPFSPIRPSCHGSNRARIQHGYDLATFNP
jgi:hypothetical protein